MCTFASISNSGPKINNCYNASKYNTHNISLILLAYLFKIHDGFDCDIYLLQSISMWLSILVLVMLYIA